MDKIFIFLWILHISIWVYVLLAFLNKTTALYNVFFVVPFIYIIQILPFHILEKLKKNIYNNDKIRLENQEIIRKILIFPYLFEQLSLFFDKSYFNPLSPQGMLVFGLLTSIHTLYGSPL
jgi:hypothetical protein